MSQDLMQVWDMEVLPEVTPIPSAGAIGAMGLTYYQRAGRRRGWP